MDQAQPTLPTPGHGQVELAAQLSGWHATQEPPVLLTCQVKPPAGAEPVSVMTSYRDVATKDCIFLYRAVNCTILSVWAGCHLYSLVCVERSGALSCVSVQGGAAGSAVPLSGSSSAESGLSGSGPADWTGNPLQPELRL